MNQSEIKNVEKQEQNIEEIAPLIKDDSTKSNSEEL